MRKVLVPIACMMGKSLLHKAANPSAGAGGHLNNIKKKGEEREREGREREGREREGRRGDERISAPMISASIKEVTVVAR